MHLAYHILYSVEMNTEVAIIGSGVLGSAMAYMLSKHGRNVVLIERQFSEPDRIVGELLQPGGVAALKTLGLGHCVEYIDAATVEGYVVHYMKSGESVKLQFPYFPNEDGIQTGRAFHHGRFIMQLRKNAMEQKNLTTVEGIANELIYENGKVLGVKVFDKELKHDIEIRAKLTIVADGFFSKFRSELSGASRDFRSNFVGVILEDCPQFLKHFAEVVLSDRGPILCYKISSHCTRVLIDIKGEMPGNLRDYLNNEVYPTIPQHMKNSFLKAATEGRIRVMPNCFLPPLPKCVKGTVILGDAFNQRHPLTGAGMSVALNDIVILERLLHNIDLSDHDLVVSLLHKFHWERKSNHSYVINILAEALYALFSARDANMKFLQEASFRYFQLGGECLRGPVALLSITDPKPVKLIGHFFAVAFYAMYKALISQGFMFPLGMYRASAVLYTALKVILPLMWSEARHPI